MCSSSVSKVNLVTRFNKAALCQKKLVNLGNVEAHDHRVCIAKLGDDVRALLAKVATTPLLATSYSVPNWLV